MKKILWTLVGIAAFLGAAAALTLRTTEPIELSTTQGSTTAGVSPSAPAADGAAKYKANVAIAGSKSDEQNPLRSYKPLPGLEGRMKLDEISAKGVPATAQSASLVRALLNSGTLSA